MPEQLRTYITSVQLLHSCNDSDLRILASPRSHRNWVPPGCQQALHKTWTSQHRKKTRNSLVHRMCREILIPVWLSYPTRFLATVQAEFFKSKAMSKQKENMAILWLPLVSERSCFTVGVFEDHTFKEPPYLPLVDPNCILSACIHTFLKCSALTVTRKSRGI